MQWNGRYAHSSSGTNGSGIYLLTIPFGLIDGTVVPTGSSYTNTPDDFSRMALGFFQVNNTSNYGVGSFGAYSATQMVMYYITSTGSASNRRYFNSGGDPSFGNTNLLFSFIAELPMYQW
jgi:hypothetical protein